MVHTFLGANDLKRDQRFILGTGARQWRVSYPADYQPQFGAGPGPRTGPVIDGTVGVDGMDW